MSSCAVTSEEVIYPGRDLEAMHFAENYHRWILDIFGPHLGSRLVEVGAGSGSFSELLLERRPESLTLIEPSAEMFALLKARIRPEASSSRLSFHNSVFRPVAEMVSSERPDSIIYVNVLEHIEDDLGELRAAHSTLIRGGKLLIFVPALRWLYSNFDRGIGHHRRYTKRGVEEGCRTAGFRVLESRYFDLPGVLPWLINYRLLGSERMEPGAIGAYDRFVVPLARAVESRLRPPLGKNVLLVAEKV